METYEAQPVGRLVMVVERELSEASKFTLRNLLEEMWDEGEVTWVSGLNRAGMLQAAEVGAPYFYNRDFVSAEQVVGLMPWREVWLVAAGKVWKLAQT